MTFSKRLRRNATRKRSEGDSNNGRPRLGFVDLVVPLPLLSREGVFSLFLISILGVFASLMMSNYPRLVSLVFFPLVLLGYPIVFLALAVVLIRLGFWADMP